MAKESQNMEATIAKREVAAPAAAEPTITEKINRTDFTALSNYLFTDFFVAMADGMTASEALFAACDPKPADAQLEANELKTLKEASKTTRSQSNTGKLESAVAKSKETAKKVASFTETTYPGDAGIAKIVGMYYNSKPGKSTPAPTVAVEKFRMEQMSGGVMVNWKPLPGLSGKVIYNLYMSTDGGKNFAINKAGRSAKGGVYVKTTPSVSYIFYMTAATTGGEGPESSRISCFGI